MPVTKRSDLLLFVAVLGTFFILASFMSVSQALVGGGSLGVFLAILQSKWGSRRDKPFWVVMTMFVLVHVLALAAIRFPDPRYGAVVFPFMIADALVWWAILNRVETHFPRTDR